MGSGDCIRSETDQACSRATRYAFRTLRMDIQFGPRGQNDQPNDEEFHVTNVSQAILDWSKASMACTEMESIFFFVAPKLIRTKLRCRGPYCRGTGNALCQADLVHGAQNSMIFPFCESGWGFSFFWNPGGT